MIALFAVLAHVLRVSSVLHYLTPMEDFAAAQRPTFTVGSFTNHETSACERARGHYEKPLGHRLGRACARYREHVSCDEQDL
jgi:hypothetical protein